MSANDIEAEKKQEDIKSRDQLAQLIWVATKITQEDARQVSSSQTIVYDVRIIDAPVTVLSLSVWFYSCNLSIHALLIPSSLSFFFLQNRTGRKLPAFYLPFVKCELALTEIDSSQDNICFRFSSI